MAALVANVDHGVQRGWQVDALLGAGRAMPSDGWDGVDDCQALVWRTSIALETAPDEHEHEYHFDEPPADLWDGIEPDPATLVDHATDPDWGDWPLAEDPRPYDEHLVDAVADDLVDVDEDKSVEPDLTLAAYIRDLGGSRLEPTDADLRLVYQRADEWQSSPVSRERMLEINDMAQAFFEAGSPTRGAATTSPDGSASTSPATSGSVPVRRQPGGPTWSTTCAAAVSATPRWWPPGSRPGQHWPADRPVPRPGDVPGDPPKRGPRLRRPPPARPHRRDKGGPKYLNTADTPLFHKGAQLFGVVDELLTEGAVPVIVEGPMDAVAVTIASAGLYLGVAPLGTSLTHEQAAQLAAVGRDPIVATDADLAGQVAAERDFWMLTPHGLDPGFARFPDGLDPADLLAQRGPAALTAAVASGQPAFRSLGDQLLTERLDNLARSRPSWPPLRVISARPSRAWEPGATRSGPPATLPVCRRDATCARRSRPGMPTRGRRHWPSSTRAARFAHGSRPRPRRPGRAVGHLGSRARPAAA